MNKDLIECVEALADEIINEASIPTTSDTNMNFEEMNIDRLRHIAKGLWKEQFEIEQILGKALGYPWFKDDKKNFPEATEEHGVCVGDHVAISLAMEAADKIKQLKERNEKLSKRHPTTEEALAQYHWLKQNSQRNK